MDNYSLVPVDHQPEFSNHSLVPVDHDPFGADGVAQPAAAQPGSPPQQVANGAGLPYTDAPAINPQAASPGESYDPDSEPANGVPVSSPSLNTSAAPISTPYSADDWARSHGELKAATYPIANSPHGRRIIDVVRGMLNPSFDEDKRIVSGIYDAAKDAVLAPGRSMQPNPYPPGSEEAFLYEDQRQKAMIPAAVNMAMLFAGLGLPTAERGAVGVFGGNLPPVARGIGEELHHPFPKYIGGAVQQALVALPKSLHYEFHSGLDERLPRWKGTAYYAGRTPLEKQQALQELSEYTKDFDAKHGTKLYDALLKNGFPKL